MHGTDMEPHIFEAQLLVHRPGVALALHLRPPYMSRGVTADKLEAWSSQLELTFSSPWSLPLPLYLDPNHRALALLDPSTTSNAIIAQSPWASKSKEPTKASQTGTPPSTTAKFVRILARVNYCSSAGRDSDYAQLTPTTTFNIIPNTASRRRNSRSLEAHREVSLALQRSLGRAVDVGS